MSELTGWERAIYIQDLFTRIAKRYDLMNRLMTGGQDLRWRKRLIRLANLQPGCRLLDIGAGTGDLTREALRQQPEGQVVSVDFTLEMMRTGLQRGALPYLAADALRLPFAEAAFDAVVSGFLLRNVADLRQAIGEQFRVLKVGGRIAVLDTTRPGRNLLSPFIRLHMHVVIPFLGRLLSGSGEAYHYLPDSSEQFVSAEELADLMTSAGFIDVQFQRFMFGTIAIHGAKK
jgi:demethylmenaquinone methyltransferase / 2-methoxy-6-polyprenyl-1,4-benzoquinol methylase